MGSALRHGHAPESSGLDESAPAAFAARQGHRGAQPALGAGRERDRAAVRLGDRAHDREPQPGAAAPRVAVEPLERLEQVASTAVPSTSPLFTTATTLRPSRLEMVTDSPAGRLWRTAFSIRFATSLLSSRRSPATDAGLRSAVPQAGSVGVGRDALDRQAAALARSTGSRRVPRPRAREREQRLDQALAAVHRVVHGFGHGSQLVRRGIGIGEGDIDFGADDRQWRSQLVRRVGDEATLGGECRLQSDRAWRRRCRPAP